MPWSRIPWLLYTLLKSCLKSFQMRIEKLEICWKRFYGRSSWRKTMSEYRRCLESTVGQLGIGLGYKIGRLSQSHTLHSKVKDKRISLIPFSQISKFYCRYTVNTTHNDTSSRIASALGAKSSSQDVPSLRIKARWQTVEILPIRAYEDLLQLLTTNYLPLCEQLEPILAVRVKEDFATSLVRILYKQNMAKEFLCQLVMREVEQLDNDHLMFRGNSLATKAMESFMKLVADDYLQSTLNEFVKTVLQCEDSCEVDPQRLGNVSNSVLEKNRALLMRYVEVAWTKILNK